MRLPATIGLTMLLAMPAHAQGPADPAPAQLALAGRIEHPRILSLADLTALPPITVAVTHTTEKGEQKASYTGSLLWPLLDAAGLVDEPGRHTHLQHVIFAHGRDGYVIALAIGELDPGFEGKQVIVAYAEEGKPLPGLRLIVPADAKAGRSVRDLVSLDVH